MHCQRALAIDAGNVEAHNNLGSALKSKGLFAEAALEYEAALAIEPDYALAIKNLADISKIQPDDPLIPRIEQLLRSESLPVERREQCHFALGKCFNDVGTYDKAFEQYRAGNEIKKERHSFDAGAYARETDRLMATFDRAFFEQRNSHGSNSERPIFIVGMPRSGTTLVEQIIASHPDVFGAGELPHFNRLVKNLPARLRDAAYPECVAGIDPKTASQLADEYLGYLRSLSPDAPQVTDKLPQNFRHLGLITLLLPHARIISCRREPLDVCLSCYFQDFFAQPFSHDLADIGRFYREYDRLMAHWISVLPLPILEVQYEDLVGDMEAVSRRMISFCGLNWDDACLAFHKHERPVQTASDWQVRQPIYRTSVERWRRYEKHLEPLKQVLTGTL
jgi:tetratricopeptide (TPR) repeat protein